MARPKIKLDLAQVEDLAGKGLTQKQICLSIGISEDTLQRRKKDSAAFAASMEKGKVRGGVEVSNKLFEQCQRGNVAAIIWYEKTRCGMSDRVKNQITNEGSAPPQPNPMEALSTEQLGAIIEAGKISKALGDDAVRKLQALSKREFEALLAAVKKSAASETDSTDAK